MRILIACSQKAGNDMSRGNHNHLNHVCVRDKFDGDVLRTIPVSRRRSGFSLATKLFYTGERNLTVYQNSQGKAGQILTGKHSEGWYISDDGISYQHTTESVMGAVDPEASRVKCQRCGYEWYARGNMPLKCPRCGSAKWKTPRSGNEPGPKPKPRKAD